MIEISAKLGRDHLPLERPFIIGNDEVDYFVENIVHCLRKEGVPHSEVEELNLAQLLSRMSQGVIKTMMGDCTAAHRLVKEGVDGYELTCINNHQSRHYGLKASRDVANGKRLEIVVSSYYVDYS
jgi:hypothetical protein